MPVKGYVNRVTTGKRRETTHVYGKLSVKVKRKGGGKSGKHRRRPVPFSEVHRIIIINTYKIYASGNHRHVPVVGEK